MAKTTLDKLAAVFVIVLIFIGIRDYLTNFSSNLCDMTYMYELPQYINVQLNNFVVNKFPRYKLYVYGEGLYAESLRDRKFNGIPVIFIPGNAGSHKQVRSLASVSYQKSKGVNYHFNYFTVDLKEEYSGLYGGTLQEQTEFLHECIKHILKLYNSNNRPSSVILIGHSMGGLIARALVTLPYFDPSLISVIFNLATPIQAPAYFDTSMKLFYDRVTSIWNENRSSSFKNINIVSIGGGHRDTHVRSSLTAIPEESGFMYDLNVLSTAIPGVWMSIDHRGIVWCKQLVLTMKRAMFDMVDIRRKQILADSMKRDDILNFHFIRKTSRSVPYEIISKLETNISVDAFGVWSEQRKSSWFYIQSKVTSRQYFAIPIRRNGILIVLAKNIPAINWIFACTATNIEEEQKMCQSGQRILQEHLLPSSDADYKFVRMDLNDWRIATHAVIQVQPSLTPVEIYSEVYDPAKRHQLIQVPWIPIGIFMKQTVIQHTTKWATFYNISLEGMQHLWQAYQVLIIPYGKKCNKENVALMKFYVPWSQEETHTYIQPRAVTTFVLKLQTPKPLWNTGNPQLHLILDQQCTYQISLSVSLTNMMGQIFRFYGLTLPVILIAVIMETLSFQVFQYLREGRCHSIFESLSSIRGFWKVVIFSQILIAISRCQTVIKFSRILPEMKDYSLEVANIHLTTLLFFLYVIAVGILRILSFLLFIPVTIFGKIISTVIFKYKSKEPGELKERHRYLSIGPSLLGSAFISCAYAMCGSIMLIVGFVFYLIKVSYLHGKLKMAERRGRDTRILSYSAQIHYTLLLLWLLTIMFLSPTLMTWIKNLRYGLQLNPDPSLFVSVILSTSLAFLWDEEGTKLHRTTAKIVGGALQALSILILSTSLESLYQAHIYTCMTFVVIDILHIASLKPPKVD